jgi:hypothetical protein
MSNTNGHRTSQPAALSVRQQNALDLIVRGYADREVAAVVGMSRERVCIWRNHDVDFIAELNRRRQAVWGASLDRLRSILSRSLDVIQRDLDSKDSETRLKTAQAVLGRFTIPLQDVTRTGPTTAQDVLLAKAVEKQRELTAHLDPLEALTREPPLSTVLPLVQAELERLTGDPDHDEAGGPGQGKGEAAGSGSG